MRSFYRLYAQRHDKARFGDKTPRYVTRLNRIGGAIPEARFIHVIRDGRDVALSLNRRLVELRDSRPVPMGRLARRWRRRILNARANRRVADRYIEVRYEDLVADTEPALLRVCEFIELDFDSGMLRYHETAAERMAEMDRDRERDGRQTVSGEERMKAHALTDEATAGQPPRGLEDGDERRGPPAVRGGRRRPADRAWLRNGRLMALFKRRRQPDRAPVPFVVGMNRSGTTLLRMMLDAHPDLTIPPETHFVPDLIQRLPQAGRYPR